jgi:hypothetical protein
MWRRDPFVLCRKALDEVCPRAAQTRGEAVIADATELAAQLGEDDLVFVDPPYSGVQYSRFYHVLETLARGECAEVSGSGRYPPTAERPQSGFCRKSESHGTLVTLFDALAEARSTLVCTFPCGECSNGLSGDAFVKVAQRHFAVCECEIVKGVFSTLGGNHTHRAPRQRSEELLLLLRPS